MSFKFLENQMSELRNTYDIVVNVRNSLKAIVPNSLLTFQWISQQKSERSASHLRVELLFVTSFSAIDNVN